LICVGFFRSLLLSMVQLIRDCPKPEGCSLRQATMVFRFCCRVSTLKRSVHPYVFGTNEIHLFIPVALPRVICIGGRTSDFSRDAICHFWERDTTERCHNHKTTTLLLLSHSLLTVYLNRKIRHAVSTDKTSNLSSLGPTFAMRRRSPQAFEHWTARRESSSPDPLHTPTRNSLSSGSKSTICWCIRNSSSESSSRSRLRTSHPSSIWRFWQRRLYLSRMEDFSRRFARCHHGATRPVVDHHASSTTTSQSEIEGSCPHSSASVAKSHVDHHHYEHKRYRHSYRQSDASRRETLRLFNTKGSSTGLGAFLGSNIDRCQWWRSLLASTNVGSCSASSFIDHCTFVF